MTDLAGDKNATPAGRVIIMVDSFPGFSETFIMDQIDGLRSRGVNVSIVAGYRNKSGLIQEKGRRLAAEAFYAEDHMGPVKLLPLIIRKRIYPRRLQRRIYEPVLRDADLVLCHFGPVGRRAALALRDLRGPRLWTIFHGYDISSYLRWVGPRAYAQLFERGDRFFGVSRLWMARLKELGCPEDRIDLLRMGIDVARIPFVERKTDIGGGVRILSVCRLVEKKGTEYALRALADVARDRPSLAWSFEIIGDGPLRASLERLGRDLGIADKVAFIGRLPTEQVHSKLAESDIFLLPSVTASSGDMEGIPVSLMEAMASGVPVLSTLHSGIPELIEDKVSGLLAPERDASTLARNLCALIDDPTLRRSLAAAARKKIESEFDQDQIADALAATIRKALAGGG